MPARHRVGLPAAVLFDLDGTIVDSEPYWAAEERHLVESFGGVWTEADAHSVVGRPLEVTAGHLLRRTAVDLPVTEVVDRLMTGVMRRLEVRCPWRPGALELLASVRAAGVPTALVTMSWRPFTDLLLRLLPPDSFDTVVSGDMVSRGKPHPEAYLTAVAALGVPVERCVAIEDSPAGVRSAVAAGVATLAVAHVVPVPAMTGATARSSLRDLRVADLALLLHADAGRPSPELDGGAGGVADRASPAVAPRRTHRDEPLDAG